MKKATRSGVYEKKQAQAITKPQEDQMWSAGVLGSSNPKQLLDTLFYLVGKNFALRNAEEHHSLRFLPYSQITLHTDGERPNLLYQETTSKTNQEGLKSRQVTGL